MMRRPSASARALRALAEGARPTLELLADAANRSHQAVRSQAEREGWRLDRAHEVDFAARVRPIVEGLVDRIEAVCRRAEEEEQGKIDKAELDGIVAMVRALEKIGEYHTRPEEAAAKNQRRRDEDLAAVLGRINDRIIHLARELAAQMVAEHNRAARGGTR